MKKLDEWLIGAKCALHRLFFGKQPGIDGIIVVTGVSIVEGKFGLFLSMPSRKDEKSETGYKDICYPISKEARKELEEIILKEFENKKDDFQGTPESGDDSIPF